MIEKPEFEDPAHDGYIIDGYLDNVKELIRHYDLATIRLPDFDFLQKSILWGVSGRNGTFKNLEDVSRVNISTLTEYDDGVTNLDTLLYIPNAQLHYRLTVLFGIDLDLDVWFFINAVHVNFNYTTGKPCNIEYNKDSIGVVIIQESTVSVYVDNLHDHWFIPQFLADFIENFIMASIGQIFVDHELLTLARETLDEYILAMLVEKTDEIDVCQIFEQAKVV